MERPTLEDRVLNLEVRLDRIIDSINHNVKTARLLQNQHLEKIAELERQIKAIKVQRGNPFGTI